MERNLLGECTQEYRSVSTSEESVVGNTIVNLARWVNSESRGLLALGDQETVLTTIQMAYCLGFLQALGKGGEILAGLQEALDALPVAE